MRVQRVHRKPIPVLNVKLFETLGKSLLRVGLFKQVDAEVGFRMDPMGGNLFGL